MKNDLTLLLCTHGRPDFVRRSLRYYEALGANVIVLDSSSDAIDGGCSANPDILYIHCPEYGYQGFREKLERGVSLVDTPYMVFVADDDFVLHDALADSIEFLQANSDYGICHGYCLMYLPEKDKVHYFLRDKKVVEDFSSESLDERIATFMSNYIPPWYAVLRTDIVKDWYSKMPRDTGMEFQEFGHAFYFLARAKARILERPYVIREVNYPVSDHGTDLLVALSHESPVLSLERQKFHSFICTLLEEMGFSHSQASELFMTACERLATCLSTQHSLTVQEIFHSEWPAFSEHPLWRFEPQQFVELPFYNRPFFDVLEAVDLLIRVEPVGKLQVSQLKHVLAVQDGLVAKACSLEVLDDGFRASLRTAFEQYPFHRELTRLLAQQTDSDELTRWSEQLTAAGRVDLPGSRRSSSGMGPGPARGKGTEVIEQWLAQRAFTPSQVQLINERFNKYRTPAFTFYVLDPSEDADGLANTLGSLSRAVFTQLVPRIVVLSAAGAPVQHDVLGVQFFDTAGRNAIGLLNELVQADTCDWLMLLRAGETLTDSGLPMAALELSVAPADCLAVYGDEIQRLSDGTLGACFRPDFNLDMLLSFPALMARHWFFRRDALIAAGGFDPMFDQAVEFDLLLRLIEQGGMAGLGHIDEALVVAEAPRLQDNECERATLLRHLALRGYQASLKPHMPGRYRIDYGHSVQPLVSIIIPTKDQLPILQRCVESLLEKTRYPNYEVLIVDNDSQTSEAQTWLAGVESWGESLVRVLRYPYPFNYSAINNMAAQAARGEYLVLLNNDTAILREDWLDAMLNHAQRPEVGVVGAKLLYPDGRIQHAGVVLGLRGPADHPFIGEAMDAPGYMQRLQVDQNYSAVTAACLMIRKSLYEEVGGLDEQAFKVSYNDVDLCLKTREAGYLTVWTPHAVVMHEGSVSQTRVDPAAQEAKRKRFVAEQDAMYAKWLPLIAADPAYNRNLSLSGAGFALEADAQLTWRPLDSWRPLPVVLAHPADPWGCGNYRVIKPFEAMRDAGLIDGMLSDGLLQVADLARYDPDVLVLQRQLGDERLEAMRRIKTLSRAFKVYELDDYLPNLPMKSLHREHMPRDVLKSLRKGLGFVDRFVVSTEALADAFSGLHADIRVIENRLPREWWQNLTTQRRRGRKPRVGWAGGVSHTGDLELIADVVKELAGEVEWVFMGMCPDRIRPYVQEVHAGVDINAYPAALASLDLDLALAPVEQNLFNECKSNLRLLEYGACGFPVVCSDLRCYEGELPVTRVKNRFKDWVDAIRMHVNDLDASARQGDALKAAVMRDWMLEGANLELWRRAWLPD